MTPNPITPNNTRQWATDKQLSARFEVSRATVWRWAQSGRFPKPIKLSPGCTRWRASDIEAWETAQEVAS
nr:AlpA family phage regulatory protein [uncultured Halomonas sp.]